MKFMVQALDKRNCSRFVDNVECVTCDTKTGGGFQPGTGKVRCISAALGDLFQVILCENQLQSKHHTELTLTHEFVHAYDDCRANVDWTNCVHHACSEARRRHHDVDSFG